MKICFVCNEYPPLAGGGIGIFVKTMAEALVKIGVDVSVVGYGKKERHPFEQNGVKIYWLTLPNIFYKKIQIGGFPYSLASLIKRQYLSLYLNKLARTEKFDLVESYDFSGPLALKPPVKLIVRLHNAVAVMRSGEGRPNDINPVDRYFERKQILDADYVVAVSNHIGKETNRVLKLSLPYAVIYNGVDTDFFKPNPGASKSKMVLFVGNILWRKGIFDLLRAVPKIISSHPSVRISIIGGVIGIHLQQLVKELARLPSSVRDRVDLLGAVDRNKLPALYNEATVFVFPSRVEAFGLTCIEAMACGCPVVATRLASGPELVEDGISGLLANPASPAELAEKINILLGDPDLAQKLGINARQRVLKRFDLRDLGQRNLAFYQSILQEAG